MTVEDEIEIELGGGSVAVSRDAVQALAAAAAARARLSSRHRELSLALGRGLESGRATLGSGEARALRAVLEEERHGLGPVRAELLRLADSA
jgi:hypothetical protein